MGRMLVIVEARDGRIRRASLEALVEGARRAAAAGVEAEALMVGGPSAEAAVPELLGAGAGKVWLALDEALDPWRPEPVLRGVEPFLRAGSWSVVLMAASGAGRDLAPRLAAQLDLPLVEDVTGVMWGEEGLRFERPILAGRAWAIVEADAPTVVATVRPGAFPVASPGRRDAGPGDVERVDLSGVDGPTLVASLGEEAADRDRPGVTDAAIVVAGGRGLRGPEHWPLLEALREALGPEAGLGATRAVVDAGWRGHAEQVGQTGKTVSPRLYIAVGISGAVQHLAGMRTSGTIVAINRDRDAPIFRVADYGIVGDLFEVVPRLTNAIREPRRDG